MLQQIYNAYKLKNEIDANLQPKYVFGDAKGVGQFLNAAKLLATEKAKNDMVDHISKDISRLLTEKASSKQIKKAQIQSVLNMVEKSKPFVTKRLNTITPVFLFYRELSNGNIEVMMSIAYDRGEITKLFKTVINEQLE